MDDLIQAVSELEKAIKYVKDNMITKDDVEKVKHGLKGVKDEMLDINNDIDRWYKHVNEKLDTIKTPIILTTYYRPTTIRQAYVEYDRDEDGEIRPIEYRYYR